MKYRFLLFILALLPFSLAAGPVPADKAGRLAGQFLRAEGSRSSSVSLLAEAPYATKSASSDQPYYIFQGDRGGFVVMAADDRVSPVIGWSSTGKIQTKDMPENIRGWLDMWRDIIFAIQAGKLAPQPGVGTEWAALEKGAQPVYAGGKELETAQWNQGNPYNTFCPGGSVTGCLATATSIIMRYHKWPKAGSGTLPGYKYTDSEGAEQTVSSIKLGHEYKWSHMPLVVDDTTDPDDQKEIARLIYEVGVMLKSSYNPSGTGAYSFDAAPGLVTYFDYDGAALDYKKAYYSDADWNRMMIENIDNVGPILYSGQSDDGGHAFILDGYNAQGQFRINWGWGGNGNGYYTMPAFEDFTMDHGAILNIHKNTGGPIAEVLYIDQLNPSTKEPGVTCSTTEFKIGQPFDIKVMYIANLSGRTFHGNIALAVAHRDGSIGEILYVIEDVYIGNYTGNGFSFTNCTLEEPIQIGDRLCFWFNSENTPEWTRIMPNLEEDTVGEIPIADAQSIEEVTSIRYATGTGILTLSTKEGITWTLKDKKGTGYTDGVKYAEGTLEIDTNLFKSGTYVLTMTKDYDSKSVELVFGKK